MENNCVEYIKIVFDHILFRIKKLWQVEWTKQVIYIQ